MQRDARTRLSNILEAALAIDEVGYGQSRLTRSAVKCEFIINGEALKLLAQRDPQLFAGIPEEWQIIHHGPVPSI